VDTFEPSHPPSARSASLDVVAETIGEAWLAIGAQILASGRDGEYDGLPVREIILATLTIDQPSSNDDVINRYADQERLAWMHTNFTDHQPVSELGDADSYATRLRDYDSSGKDQLRWVVERLRSDPTTRSATITTLQPLSDTSYIPCISLLDFFILADELQLVVYAHSIDFGTKGYANLVELAHLQEEVAPQLGVDVGTLTLIVKSAHVYSSDEAFLRNVERAREVDGAI
jgi:thymidylate synthase